MGLLLGKTPGIVKPAYAKDLGAKLEVVQRVGPLVLMHLSCPSSENYGNKWIDLEWTHAINPLLAATHGTSGLVMPRKCRRPTHELECANSQHMAIFQAFAYGSDEWSKLKDGEPEE